MAKFLVTTEMYPGMYRNGVGFFAPGNTVTLPDAASVPDERYPSKLQPLDAAAESMLAKQHPELAKAGKIKKVADFSGEAKDPKTVDAKPEAKPEGKPGRAADK